MIKVLTFGVFDYFHIGHLRLFKRCANLGDYLIVAVQKDEEIKKTKPNCCVLYDLSQRMEMVESLKCVDCVIPYSQIDIDIKNIDFDILVVGPDQKHEGFQRAFRWCDENKKTVIILERTQGISSSQIKEKIKKLK